MQNDLVVCPEFIDIREVFFLQFRVILHILFFAQIVSVVENDFNALLLQNANEIVSQFLLGDHPIDFLSFRDVLFKELNKIPKLRRMVLEQLKSVVTAGQESVVDHLVVVGLA